MFRYVSASCQEGDDDDVDDDIITATPDCSNIVSCCDFQSYHREVSAGEVPASVQEKQ